MERNGIVALVSCGTDNLYNNPFVQSFSDECAELGLNVLWFQSLSNKYDGDAYDVGEMNIFKLINFDIIDALALMSITLVDKGSVMDELIQKARSHNIPIISMDVELDSAYCISQGYEEALKEVIRHVSTEHGA